MGHFYDPLTGEPRYTIIGANGKERDTTLRDAKKLGLVASVTTITGQLSKGNLDRWKQLQLLNIVQKYPNLINKQVDWKEQLIGMSDEENSKYSKIGTEVHNRLEEYFKTGVLDTEYNQMLVPIITTLHDLYGKDNFLPELSFAHISGYGGKIDLIIQTPEGKVIIDFKTKSVETPGKEHIYDDYLMQLSAYSQQYDDVLECLNILISVTNLGVFYIHRWSEEQVQKGKEMFNSLLRFYQLRNNLEVRA